MIDLHTHTHIVCRNKNDRNLMSCVIVLPVDHTHTQELGLGRGTTFCNHIQKDLSVCLPAQSSMTLTSPLPLSPPIPSPYPPLPRVSVNYASLSQTLSLLSLPHPYQTHTHTRGGNAPSYVYRLISELYHPDDQELQ